MLTAPDRSAHAHRTLILRRRFLNNDYAACSIFDLALGRENCIRVSSAHQGESKV